jgi:hypothetical protein
MKKRKRRHRTPLIQLVLPSPPVAQPAPVGGQSEVARLKAQIEAEAQAGRRALYGEALGTAQHQFITRRMERMGVLHEELGKLLPPEDAVRALIEAMEKPEEDT